MDFFEVTGGRVLSFRNVSVREPAGPDLSGQSLGASELKKSPSSFWGWWKLPGFSKVSIG